MLPDIFEGLALTKKLMDSKPDGYTTFEKFVDDIQNGRDPIKAPKKKKKKAKAGQEAIQQQGGAWFPQRPLNLPEPEMKQEPVQPPVRQQKQKKVRQWSYYGPGTERPRVYGRGKITGQNYYGDGRDVYYPPNYQHGGGRGGRNFRGQGQGRGNQRQMHEGPGSGAGAGFGPVGYGSTGRKVSGGVLQQEAFSMGDMQAALAYYNYDQQQQRRRPLHQKN